MDYNKYEDAVFKKAMEIFQQSAVNFFNIHTKIITPAATKIKDKEHTEILINHIPVCSFIIKFSPNP